MMSNIKRIRIPVLIGTSLITFSTLLSTPGPSVVHAQKAGDLAASGMSGGKNLDIALAAYEKKNFQDAALGFQSVIAGGDAADPGVQKAQFFLGKSLYQLKFYQSSLAIFDEISQNSSHTFFAETLQWIGQLASRLPPSAGIIEKVGRYGEAELRRFDKADTKELYHHLLFLMGQKRYTEGEFQRANALFNKIAPKSPWYIKAKFFEGISYVRMRRAKPAVATFREILKALEEGDIDDLEEEDRLQDLAWISLARVYYSAASKTSEDGERQVDGRVLGNAIEAWNRIGAGSEYWLDALFEESWAFFLADEYSRALGNVHTLLSPYFEEGYYPEALVLKAVTFFANCQMDNATATVDLFHRRYDPVKTELDLVLAKYKDNAQFFEFLQRVRKGEAQLSTRIKSIVYTALSDRTLLRHLEYHRILEEEEQLLAKSPAAFRQSSLGERINEDIAVAKSFAVDETGNLARGRYKRLVDELQDLNNQTDAVEAEIISYKRGQLSQELQQQQLEVARTRGGKVEVDEEHQIWPFDGEYWRDELGFYRQEVTSKCGR